MGRKRPSPIEGLLVIASRIPWWAGLLVALVSFLYLRSVALQEVQSSGSALENMGPAMISQIYISLARIFQYVLPLIFCIGAGISFFKASKRKGLLASACANGSSESIHNMSWHDFELLVGQIFRERGYQVIDNDSKGADGGVDLVLRKDNETFLVQCKHWKAYKVSVQIVRELYGVMASR
ncbi:MAG: restriction endonuclease, partial [Pseudohongiellaceae bacterium]